MKTRLLMLGKVFGATLCMLVTGFVLFLSPVLWKMPVHNIKLSMFQKNFERIDHPHASRLIARHREFGNFGNSNHCDYFVGEFRAGDVPRDEIISQYQGLHIPPPDDSLGVWDGDPPTETAVEVYFADDPVFEHWPWSDWLERYASRLPEARENAYLVFAMETGYPPIGDLRCH